MKLSRVFAGEPFNSLSRDHSPELLLTYRDYELSTPSLGITGDSRELLLPHPVAFNSLSRDHKLDGRAIDLDSCVGDRELSTPSLGITDVKEVEAIKVLLSPFNSLSRDHSHPLLTHLLGKLRTFNSLSRDHSLPSR
jgi:hypothetical protein